MEFLCFFLIFFWFFLKQKILIKVFNSWKIPPYNWEEALSFPAGIIEGNLKKSASYNDAYFFNTKKKEKKIETNLTQMLVALLVVFKTRRCSLLSSFFQLFTIKNFCLWHTCGAYGREPFKSQQNRHVS